MIGVWDSPVGGAAAAMVRSAMTNDMIAKMMREFIVNRILKRVAKELDLDPAEGPIRANLVGSQMAGLIMLRYIIKIEPLASAPVEAVVGSDRPDHPALYRRTAPPPLM